MIGYLKGEVLEHSDGKVILSVGSAAEGHGIGYLVTVPQSAAYGAITAGRQVELFVHTHVREDALDLYGFASRIEKEIFLTLLGVTGIGPKGAVGILSKVDPAHLVQAILDGDKDSLTQIPGVGKKTAERVVMELADPVRKKMESGAWGENKPLPASSARAVDEVGGALASTAGERAMLRDAREALVGLGYREGDVSQALKKAMEGAPAAPRAEELIRSALQMLR